MLPLLLILMGAAATANAASFMIINSTLCGPAYSVDFAAHLIYGNSGGQDAKIASLEPTCAEPRTECIAFQCARPDMVLYGPRVVYCNYFHRQWKPEFPYCAPYVDICSEDPMAEAALRCWRKKQRWRYNAQTKKCVQVETCARSPELGGTSTNVFATLEACFRQCNGVEIARRLALQRMVTQPFRILPAPDQFTTLPGGPWISKGQTTTSSLSSSSPRTPNSVVTTRVTTIAPQSGGLRGPQCLKGVPPTHSSCKEDSKNLDKTIQISSRDVDEILLAHNRWRRGVNPPAAVMPDLKWDQDLATTAERFAAQCIDSHDKGDERAVPNKWLRVGQNMRVSSPEWNDPTWTQVVNDWGEEYANWQYGVGATSAGDVVTHYTQIIWSETTSVGCGKAKCQTPGARWVWFVYCNYGPAGNLESGGLSVKTPYKISSSPPPLPATPSPIAGPTPALIPTAAPSGTWKSGKRGPNCIAGVPPTHSSCQDDSPNLVAFRPITNAEIQEILNAHNLFRRSTKPKAVNIPDLRWDEELAISAERRAAQCKFDHDTPEQRKLPRFEVGQNINGYSGVPDYNWTQTVRRWAKEREDWQYGIGSLNGMEVAHYTQVVWADTLYVGCGWVNCTLSGSQYDRLFFCNYGPAGNGLSPNSDLTVAKPFRIR